VAYATDLVYWYLWGAVALVLAAMVRAIRRHEMATPDRVLAYMVIASACAVVHAVLRSTVDHYLLGFTRTTIDVLRFQFAANMLVALSILALLDMAEYRLRARNAEDQRVQLAMRLVEAQLQNLRSQLQPHFLFNTLNSVAALARSDPEQAAQVIDALSDILRRCLRQDAHEIPLTDELRVLERYMDIQHIRFPARLSYAVEVSPALAHARIPPLLLQPLVENAIRHGVLPNGGAGRVVVRATSQAGNLCIEVVDDGVGVGARPISKVGEGIGISNIRQRLAWMYGGSANLALERAPSGGTIARVTLPFRLDGPCDSTLDIRDRTLIGAS
jgi:sensor histidine kinase YesM